MLQVSNIRVRGFTLGALDVYWDITPGYEDVGDYTFTLLRSEAEFGPYLPVTAPFRNAFQVRDNSVPNWHAFYNRIYYRVLVTHRTTAETATYPELGGASLGAKPDLIALEMARLNNLRLKEFSGRALWVYPRRRSGQHCTVCFDRVRQRRLRADCQVCWGTSWVGGYNAPVLTYGQVVTPAQSNTPVTLLLLGNYPDVDEGDLVVEAENVRWRVGPDVQKVSKGRAMIRQQATIVGVPIGDIEYLVPLNLTADEMRDSLGGPERNYTNPQTLTSNKLGAALSGLYGKRP